MKTLANNSKYDKRRSKSAKYKPKKVVKLLTDFAYDDDGFKLPKSLRNPEYNKYGSNSLNFEQDGFSQDWVIGRNPNDKPKYLAYSI